jgi:hypothetical protein
VLANTNDDASAPVRLMLEIVSAALPVLVIVTACDALVAPGFSLPKFRLVADKLTAGAPVSLAGTTKSVTLCLQPMVCPATTPVAFGANCLIRQW